MIIEKFKHNNKTICYISKYNSNFTNNEDKFVVSTGKPSDRSCLSWNYENLQDAKNTANKYVKNYSELPF
tara:strand:- start:10217 stop:10426 length:210 start_codon:yes stop_codon:yes gene_type:complete